MLRELFLRGGCDVHSFVTENRAAGGCPLIDGENVFHRNPFEDRFEIKVSDDASEGSKNLPLSSGHSYRSSIFGLKDPPIFKYQERVAVVQTHFGYQIEYRSEFGFKQVAVRVTFHLKRITSSGRGS